MSKIIEKILNDPRVEDISDERHWTHRPPWAEENGDGFWIYTAHGYCVESGHVHSEAGCLHSAHEDSPTATYKAFRERVQPCDCERCTS